MDRSTFETQLRTAAQQAVQLARQYVRKVLPDDVVFLVYPKPSCDDDPRVGDEAVFPGESLSKGRFYGPWQFDEVLSF